MSLKVAKEKKGITLIALVITIIVLLILAGVSIATLTGENGILTRANDAKAKTEQAGEDELRRLTVLEAATNLETYLYEDINGDTATIPAGFEVSQVEGENTIADGLVVIDKNGNEFIWIPVENPKEMYWTYEQQQVGQLYEFLSESTSSKMTEYGKESFREPDVAGVNGWCDDDISMLIEAGLPENSTIEDFKELLQNEFKQMIESIENYNGFYIGRYETGGFNGRKVVSKKGEGDKSTNSVTWYTMYRMQKELYSNDENNSVVSSMIWGCEWDATLRWLQKSSKEEVKNYVIDSSQKGNYGTGNIITTGSNENYKINNIYDLAGNLFEWTLETAPGSRRTIRGGSFALAHSGSKHPVSYRSNSVTSNRGDLINNVGSRLQLYIK